MSEHKIQGGTILLFIDPNGGTNYDTVVCLTSVSQSDSVQPVDASSACGPDKSPGAIDLSISFEGQHLQDPNSGQISGTDLRMLLRAEQTIGWKLSPVSPQPGDEIQEGTGYLSDLSSTYSYSEIGVFSGTIQPYGVPTTTTQSSRFSFMVNTSVINIGDIILQFGNNLDINVYWGDGNIDNLIANNNFQPSHTYNSLGNYLIEFEVIGGYTQLNFQVNQNDVISVNNINIMFPIGLDSALYFNNCNLTSSLVNNILHQCLSAGFGINTYINLSNNNPIAPATGQGLIDKATLEANACTVIVDAAAPALALGDIYAGGTIAYLDGTGEHGFVIYGDVGGSTYWQEEIPGTLTGANGSALGTGGNNTNIILSSGALSAPAIICNVNPYNGYSDWKWPAKDEMITIINNNSYYPALNLVATYWTSTEVDSSNAYICDSSGNTYSVNKNTNYNLVPLRYF